MNRSPHRPLHALLASVALVLGVAAVGCGGSDGEGDGARAPAAATEAATSPSQRPPAARITVAQVRRAAPGTPQRTVLEWWRDVQLNDPEHAHTLYAEAPTLPNLSGQFNFVAGWLDGEVRVLEVREEGDRAVLRLRWRKPGGEVRQVTMRLADGSGDWKLLDARFIDQMVAARQHEEGAGEGETG